MVAHFRRDGPFYEMLMRKAMTHRLTSRERYRTFIDDYKHRRLEDPEIKKDAKGSEPSPRTLVGGKRREYLRDYVRWLRPHRMQLVMVFGLSLIVAGVDMI